jgi:hypothetical protein
VADTARQKSKLTLASALIPEHAEPGSVYVAKNDASVWYASRSGLVINLTDLLSGEQPVRVLPVNGRDGKDSTVPGPKGDKGDPGRDSIIPGPQGVQGVPGKDSTVPGPKGDKGDACQCRTELTESRTATRVEDATAVLRSELESARADVRELRSTVQALIDANSKGKQYVEWLRSRVAARKNRQSKEN